MQKEEFINLLTRVAEGTASEGELALYLEWYKQFPESVELWGEWNGNPATFKAELLQRINDQIDQSGKTVRLWPRIKVAVSVAAAAIAIIVLGIYFFNYHGTERSAQGSAIVVNDIAPGKHGATITLANGKVIQLSGAQSGVVIADDKLVYNDGSLSPRVLEGSEYTASTAKGQTYEFTLPDGTKVWLNADSRISFPSQFSGKERKILLLGEAYFEVAKNKKKPFIVATDKQEVMVLGTHFNINSYADEGSVKTTLLEGSVSVRHDGEAVVLKPGEQASLKGVALQVKAVDPKEALAWKNGEFVFKDEPLQDIMRRVARWYDVEVIYEGVDKTKLFTGTISRFEKISKVLDILQATEKVKFSVAGRKVTVTR